MVAQSELKKYPCPSCGAYLAFNPGQDVLKCEYCGWKEAIPQSSEEVEERSYEQYLHTNKSELIALSSTALEVSCDRCGATVTFEPPKIAGKCSFCAANLVGQPKVAAPTLAPEGIIPFAFGRQEARQNLVTWLSKKWLAPNNLKDLAQLEKIHGIYLPFWTYDTNTVSHYKGERGDYYYETETYTTTNDEGEEVEESREVRHTDWCYASGTVQRFFDDILVTATMSLNSKRLDALEPWHLQESLRPYEPSYLAGFEAQRPQISLKEGFDLAKNLMSPTIRRDIKRDIGGDEQRISSVSTNYSAITFKHILLPIWLASYVYNQKQYQVIINARTGEVQGDSPISAWKIIKIILIIAVIVGIIVIIMLNN